MYSPSDPCTLCPNCLVSFSLNFPGYIILLSISIMKCLGLRTSYWFMVLEAAVSGLASSDGLLTQPWGSTGNHIVRDGGMCAYVSFGQYPFKN